MTKTILPSKSRDLRLDFFRGLALIMIFIDHVPGNYLAQFTAQNFGYSDAAEIFVLVAGIASVMAFGSIWRQRGAVASLRAVLARAIRLYTYHLAVVTGLALLAFVFVTGSGDRAILSSLGIEAFFSDPGMALAGIVSLTFLPNFMDILPLYVVLIASLVVILPLQRIHYALPLLPSLALYGAAQQFGWNLPNHPHATVWFFNPFAWQFLFVTGAIIAAMMRNGIRVDHRLSWALTAAAGSYSAFTLLHAAPWAQIPELADWRLITMPLPVYEDKVNLSPWRLADILAKAWLVGVFVAPAGRLLNSLAARAIQLLGRHSLDVFSVSTLLAVAAGMHIHSSGSSFETMTAFNLFGIAAMFLTAYGLETRFANFMPAVRSLAAGVNFRMLRPKTNR